ncbi:hypothetical protein HC891_21950 [Candidatus Gracilibacteria bacterium]|nr:hypothetical protein [Candidatus Gracilibacteria bacterium]
MVGALLDLSRIQTGQITLNLNELNLVTLLQRIVDDIQPTLSDHTIALRGVQTDVMISGDELRLEQVFHNLIGNAVKYSPAGGAVQIHLEVQGAQCCVAVKDAGIGIAVEALPHLFERFYRAPNESNRVIGGLGVGLYVVREIVTLHGGTIAVESVEDQGSTFTVWLPSSPITQV